ncbi:MAG: TOBE domain-containing protein, partial [Actinobacteria bacterium]|nr:TOBE domain-containing protein [Actinomycetota bacterium]
IAVMSQGRVEQVGGPKEIYEEPSTAYVADFLGVSNLMGARAAGSAQDGCAVKLGDFDLVAGKGDASSTGEVKVTIRPERVVLEEAGSTGENRVPGMVERTVYVGSIMQILVNLANGSQIQAWVPNDGVTQLYPSGTAVGVFMPSEALRVLPDAGTPVLVGSELDQR